MTLVKLKPMKGSDEKVILYEFDFLTHDEDWNHAELEKLDHYFSLISKKDILHGLNLIYNLKVLNTRKLGRNNKVEKHYELIARHLNKDEWDDDIITKDEMTKFYLDAAKNDLSRTSFWRLKKRLGITSYWYCTQEVK